MRLRKPPRPKRPHIKLQKGAFLLSWPVDHDPDDLCGGRRLKGAEFRARKAELEARDRAEVVLRTGLDTGYSTCLQGTPKRTGKRKTSQPKIPADELRVSIHAAARRNRSTTHEARP